MSGWSSWLLGGGEEEKSDETAAKSESEQKKEDVQELDGWRKGLEIAGGWLDSATAYANTITDTVKKQVNETTSSGLLGEFQEEQEKFERKRRHAKDASVPPWVGYNEEEQIKTQVFELSADSRNFLREPPHGVNFEFDYNRVAPVAMVMLDEDPRLQKLRFELVPKKVPEKTFWRNYFYRVSLIKQSVQLSTLSSAESPKPSLTNIEAREQPDSNTDGPHSQNKETEQIPAISGEESAEEFASDQLYNSSAVVSKETVENELSQLGVAKNQQVQSSDDSSEKMEDWDELRAELDELDLEGTDPATEDNIPADWEEELQSMLSEDVTTTD